MVEIEVQDFSYTYGEKPALERVTFAVEAGKVVGILGPNGSGKTTLFRVLSTALRPQTGRVQIHGFDVARHQREVRRLLGVLFQAFTLDRELTVRENLVHQGHLYGLFGQALREAIERVITQLRLGDYRDTPVRELSGGFRRRLDLARALLHSPTILLLDEPTTGLDPKIRNEFWTLVHELNRDTGLTVLFTTHLLDEAERADHLLLLAGGRLVCQGSPEILKRRLGAEILVLKTRETATVAEELRSRFGLEPLIVNGTLRIEHGHSHDLVAQLMHAFGDRIESVTVAHPTLEDVFIRETGQSLA